MAHQGVFAPTVAFLLASGPHYLHSATVMDQQVEAACPEKEAAGFCLSNHSNVCQKPATSALLIELHQAILQGHCNLANFSRVYGQGIHLATFWIEMA